MLACVCPSGGAIGWGGPGNGKYVLFCGDDPYGM
jgi:hypothetical protein